MADFDEHALDPELVARLRARFGDPEPPRRSVDPELLEVRRRRERAAASADPELVARLGSHEGRADALRPRSSARVRADTSIARFDLGAWRLSMIGEPVWYEQPDDVREALQHRAPQALLRDLHRPELHFGEVALRPRAAVADPLGVRARDLVRDLMRRSYRARPADLSTASRLAAEGLAELRELLAAPWQRALPEEPSELPGLAPTPEDARWFGIQGGYDPDQ